MAGPCPSTQVRRLLYGIFALIALDTRLLRVDAMVL